MLRTSSNKTVLTTRLRSSMRRANYGAYRRPSRSPRLNAVSANSIARQAHSPSSPPFLCTHPHLSLATPAAAVLTMHSPGCPLACRPPTNNPASTCTHGDHNPHALTQSSTRVARWSLDPGVGAETKVQQMQQQATASAHSLLATIPISGLQHVSLNLHSDLDLGDGPADDADADAHGVDNGPCHTLCCTPMTTRAHAWLCDTRA